MEACRIFPGARGVRQGGLISLTIFVLSMNVLSMLLDTVASLGVFAFHPKCKKLGLTHLCFTEDLLIFTKGNLKSISRVQAVL